MLLILGVDGKTGLPERPGYDEGRLDYDPATKSQ